jgi:pyridoxine 4-dehydrogenase
MEPQARAGRRQPPLDVVNLRIPRSAEGASIGEHFAALAALRAAGLIRHLGVSGISAEQLAEARAIAPVVCVQNRYGLEASAADHALLDLCGTQGIAFVPFFAVAGPAAFRGGAARPMRPSRRSPKHTTPRRLRPGWPGPCIAARTCSPSPAPVTPRT